MISGDSGVGSGWGRNDTLSAFALGPEVFAGQQYVRPAQRRDMRQEFRRNIKPFNSPLGDCMAEADGVPIDDDRREQV